MAGKEDVVGYGLKQRDNPGLDKAAQCDAGKASVLHVRINELDAPPAAKDERSFWAHHALAPVLERLRLTSTLGIAPPQSVRLDLILFLRWRRVNQNGSLLGVGQAYDVVLGGVFAVDDQPPRAPAVAAFDIFHHRHSEAGIVASVTRLNRKHHTIAGRSNLDVIGRPHRTIGKTHL